jgi:prefoldin subunit 5
MQVSLNQINARLVELNGDVATIQTDIGTIENSINNIRVKLTAIQGDTATISTELGDLN